MPEIKPILPKPIQVELPRISIYPYEGGIREIDLQNPIIKTIFPKPKPQLPQDIFIYSEGRIEQIPVD